MKKYKVYSLVSSKCVKQYIGMTGQELSVRYSGHKMSFKTKRYKFYMEIRELQLTIEDFNIVLIKDFSSRQEALEFEKTSTLTIDKTVGVFNSKYIEDEWNLGTTHTVSAETRDKISKANKGQIPYSKGKKQPTEHTAKISAALTGKKLSKEHKEAMSKAQKGLSRSFKIVVCPHCRKEVKENVAYRWHFDNCKSKVV